MGNLKEIRNRIASVKNTRKITSAMSRIASARLRKAQNSLESRRTYGERLAAVVAEVIGGLDDPEAHAYLVQRRPEEVHKVALVVVTADRGLCGGFNSNVNRAAGQFYREQVELGHEVAIVAAGKKSLGYLKQLDIEVERVHPAPEIDAVIPLAKELASRVTAMFEGGHALAAVGPAHEAEAESKAASAAEPPLTGVDEIYLVYNHFKNVITQEVRLVRLLPFAPAAAQDLAEDEPAAKGSPAPDKPKKVAPVREFEPGEKELLEHLLPIALESKLAQAFANSAAAEIAARRSAMDSATKNAGELIGELTLQFNRERQAAITKELMEIVGGAEALKG